MNVNKRMTKILLAITLVIIVSSLILLFVNVRRTTKMLERDAFEQLEVLTESKANEFDILLERIESPLKSVNSLINDTLDLEQFKSDPDYVAEYDEMLAGVIKENIKSNDVIGMYAVFNPELIGFAYDVDFSINDGSLVRAPMFKIEDFNLDSGMTDWYYAAKKANKPIWLKPYFRQEFNTDIISYEIPIYKGDELLAVLGTSFDFKIVRDKINNMKVYENGYVFLLDENYDVLVHPVFAIGENLREVANGKLQFIIDKMSEKVADTIVYEYNGKEKVLSFQRTANGNIIALTVLKEEIVEYD